MLNRLQGMFASFQKHEVKYLVIGGIAAVLHGVPRATFDLDILIEATPDNVPPLSPIHPFGRKGNGRSPISAIIHTSTKRM